LDTTPSGLQALPEPLAFAARPLVAVLPFEPRGGGPELRLLCNDLADRLRESLERDPVTQAILISSEFLSKAPPHAVELICRELRVGHLISGRCHASGDEPSLYVELTDTRDWHIRWAEFYPGGARALLADQGEAMDALVRDLRTELTHVVRR
jgi:TolB-like protein